MQHVVVVTPFKLETSLVRHRSMFKKHPVQRIEVLTGEQKCRHYTPEEKARLLRSSCYPVIQAKS